MSYIKKRHNTWYARLGIPASARPFLGRNEFVKSLQTASKPTAERRAIAYISEWKEQIASVLSDDSLKTEANWWKAAYEESTSREQCDSVLHVMSDRAEAIERQHSLEEAQRFYKLATGAAVDLSDHIDAWHQVRLTEVSQKYADTSKKRLERMAAHFGLSSNVDRKGVVRWIEKQRETLAVPTVRKIIKICGEYWAFLQSRDLVPEGPSPFEGHQIKIPTKETLHKDMKPYTAIEIVKLYRAALRKKKINLAYCIHIGAYTGFRQDEICQLKVEDVIEEEGVRCLILRNSKTKAGFRTVPIAAGLEGLIDKLLLEATESDSEYLLQGETLDSYGKRNRNISKQFTKLKTDMGFGERYDFHSIRRTVATLLEQAKVDELHAARLLGHKVRTMSYGLYSGGTSMTVLKEAVEKISYGDQVLK